MNKAKKYTKQEWEESIISMTEAAEMLDVSRQRVHVLLQNGQLEGFKVGNTWNVYKSSVKNRLAR